MDGPVGTRSAADVARSLTLSLSTHLQPSKPMALYLISVIRLTYTYSGMSALLTGITR